ncbi:hypothetical protein L7F22_014621 [Adiantum nelumboides]|nr:hypothetical protein [Adiantum nelumboides]
MAGGGTQQSLRRALGALKDTTKVGLAKVNSEFKDFDIAIVKATNHVECPPKDKHVRVVFAATSASRPRADVAYCLQALARRLTKTHNWTPYGYQMHWEQCRGYRELKPEKNQSITRNYRGWLCSVLVKLWWNQDKDSGLLRIPYLQTVLGRVLRLYAAQISPKQDRNCGIQVKICAVWMPDALGTVQGLQGAESREKPVNNQKLQRLVMLCFG